MLPAPGQRNSAPPGKVAEETDVLDPGTAGLRKQDRVTVGPQVGGEFAGAGGLPLLPVDPPARGEGTGVECGVPQTSQGTGGRSSTPAALAFLRFRGWAWA